jgi:ATP-binding cassette subfamily C protein
MTPSGRPGLRQVVAGNWSLFSVINGFSVFLNILMLTGPVCMLHVYDRVLASGSVETLVAMAAQA